MSGLYGTAVGLLLLWFSSVGKQHIAQNRYDIASSYFNCAPQLLHSSAPMKGL